MSLILRDPTLLDTALCAVNLLAEDRGQWYEFTGLAYNADATAIECHQYPGPKWAICDETGMALAVAGCRRMRPHVYQSWFLSGQELWTHGKVVTDVTRKVMLAMLDDDAHRIETLSVATRKRTHSWYEAVGLHYEARFDNYCVSGADAIQHVITRSARA